MPAMDVDDVRCVHVSVCQACNGCVSRSAAFALEGQNFEVCSSFDHYSSSQSSPLVSSAQDLRIQMSRIAFAEMPYSIASSAAVRDVLVFFAL